MLSRHLFIGFVRKDGKCASSSIQAHQEESSLNNLKIRALMLSLHNSRACSSLLHTQKWTCRWQKIGSILQKGPSDY